MASAEVCYWSLLSLISKIVTVVEIISYEYPSPVIELRLKSLRLHCLRKQADIMLVNCAQVSFSTEYRG